MPFRLTILLLLAIFGAMYLAPDAPPRPERAARAAEGTSVVDATRDRLAAVQEALRGNAPEPGADPVPEATAQPATPPPPAPLAPDAVSRAAPADLPTVTVTPDPVDDGLVTLPGLGFGDTGGDTAAALSLSDAARARAAQAAAAALANAPDDPVAQSVAEAANDLLRGLVADDPAAPAGSAVTVTAPPPDAVPQPTDPTPPPAGQFARITGTAVNLRAGPSTANDVVGQVSEGQTLRVLDPDTDGWATIENPATGENAYIASRFLEILP